MPAVLLTILKITGIVLLCILGFVLLVLLALLIIPFRYRINGRKTETESDKILDALKAEIHVTWLLHFAHASVIFDRGLDLWIKILGIKFIKKNLWNGPKPKDHNKDADEDDSYWPDDFDEDFTDEYEKQPEITEDTTDKESVNEPEKESVNEPEKESVNEPEKESVNESVKDSIKESDSEDVVNKEKAPEGKSLKEENKKSKETGKSSAKNDEKDIFDRIGEKTEEISELLEKPEEFVDKAVDTYDYYSHLLGTKGAEKSIEFLKEETLKILKSLRPRKSCVYVDFASTDPEKTAKVYELYGCLLGIMPKKSKVYIDFDDDRLYFDITLKGNIYLGYIIIHGLKILLNKRIKKFIKLLKREDK